MEKERYLLSDMEVRRAVVLERVLERTMTIREAAEKLSLSERHVKRLKAGVKSEGAAFLAHHNRGRRPKHAIPESLRRRVVELAAGAYRGANYSHLAELMAEHDQIFLSTSSVTRILRAAGVASSRKRRPPKQHPSRPRRPRFGELVLGDGSPYAWFEERGPSCCLQGFIDDATGQVVAAVFRPHEDLQGYFEITRQMAQAHGLPLFMYTDQHTIFISNDHKLSIEEELAGHPAPLTQYGRALHELKIGHIKALSPQAKGRIERLWETLQSRLTIELRLAGACSLEDGNRLLPALLHKHNQRFAVSAADLEPAFRPAPDQVTIERILCRHEERTISNGLTVSCLGTTYQIFDGDRMAGLTPRTRVTLHLLADGSVDASYRGAFYRALPFQHAQLPPALDPSSAENDGAGLALPRRPAQGHPWRHRPDPKHLRPSASNNPIIPTPDDLGVTDSQHSLG